MILLGFEQRMLSNGGDAFGRPELRLNDDWTIGLLLAKTYENDPFFRVRSYRCHAVPDREWRGIQRPPGFPV